MLLSAKPSDFGLAASPELPHVWGAMVEWHVKKIVVSVVAVAEGSTSLYLSSGGGILGGGEHESVRSENRKLLTFIERTLPMFVPVDSLVSVLEGAVTFTVLTYEGLRGARDKEPRIAEGKSPLLPAYYLGQQVVTALRLSTEKLGTGR